MRLCIDITYIIAATLLSLWLVMRERESDVCTHTEPRNTLTATIVKCDTIRLIFGGDLMQHTPQIYAARRSDNSHDYSATFEYIAPIFKDADMAVLNFETTITTSGNYSGYPYFASPPAIADAMVDMGIDIALLANNHCCDRYANGINTTIDELTRRGIAHTGVYKDSVDHRLNNIQRFERKGVKFALINYTYGTNGMPIPNGCIVNVTDTAEMQRTIRSIPRDSVDCLIACMHWGVEYQRVANSEQRALANMLRREGADIIIGSHPHVVQPYEADSTHIVYYSLGNLVSNQQWRYSDGGIIAEVEVIRCDTLDGLRFSTIPHPVWVLCPGYRILPRSVGDTLKMPATSRAQYNTFMSDTDKLLKECSAKQ